MKYKTGEEVLVKGKITNVINESRGILIRVNVMEQSNIIVREDQIQSVENLDKLMCKWEQNKYEDAAYATGCGNHLRIYVDYPSHDEIIYCPYCGRKIEVVE